VTIEEYFLPESLLEATQILAEHEETLLVVAGGTVAMPLINEGVSTPEKVMGLNSAGLSYIEKSNGNLTIGAMTSLSTLLDLKSIPMLSEAARNTGAWTTRNLGTIGGNLFVPSPAGDVAVALLALDARVKVANTAGERTIPLVDFFTGFMNNVMKSDELLVEIIVPIPKGETAYIKHGRKMTNTPAVVTVAAQVTAEASQISDARIALGAVGPHPIRALKAESVLAGSSLDPDVIQKAAAAAAEECEPFTDAVASEWYRRKMVTVIVRRALNQIAEKEV
jgi:CO/xanthine dehydrogenase FAD-binding subunit